MGRANTWCDYWDCGHDAQRRALRRDVEDVQVGINLRRSSFSSVFRRFGKLFLDCNDVSDSENGRIFQHVSRSAQIAPLQRYKLVVFAKFKLRPTFFPIFF